MQGQASDVRSQGWAGRLAMLFLVLWSGHLGAWLLGGGALAYLIGAAAGAGLALAGRQLWPKTAGLGRLGLLAIGAAIIFGGYAAQQARMPPPAGPEIIDPFKTPPAGRPQGGA